MTREKISDLEKKGFKKVSGMRLNDNGFGENHSWYVNYETGEIAEIYNSQFGVFPDVLFLDRDSPEYNKYFEGTYATSC